VGNLKKMAKKRVMILEAVEMNRRGMSNEAIAEKLGVLPRCIVGYLNDFLASEDCRFPVSLSPQDVDLLRSDYRQRLMWTVGHLARAMTELEDDPSIEAKEALAKLSDAMGRTMDRLAKLDGLNAPEPQPIVTNNNLLISNGGTNEVQVLRDLARYKELQLNGTASREA
jgi:hypothetical protein